MTIKLISAFVLAFLFATAFGRFYIPWLQRQKAEQQIREEGPNWHKKKIPDELSYFYLEFMPIEKRINVR